MRNGWPYLFSRDSSKSLTLTCFSIPSMIFVGSSSMYIPAHRCAGIYIELDPTKIIDGIEKQVSVKLLLESLENKYGHPFRIEDGVQGSKTITWRTSDQIVEYHCISVEGVPHLIIIRYEPKTKDL